MLTTSGVAIFFLGPVADHQRFARQGIASLILSGNIGAYKYSGDYFSPNPNPLVHTWSLAVEEQIYLFLPLILMLILGNRKSLKKSFFFLLVVISALSFISFLFPIILEPLYSRVGIESYSQFSFYSPIERLWQFTVGGLVFLALDSFQARICKVPDGIHFIFLIALVMTLFCPIHANPRFGSILASCSTVIVILFKSLDALPNFLIHKLIWVGDRSYSIYLFHMPLLYLAKYSPVTQFGHSDSRIIQSTIAVIVSILIGAVSYSNVENRYRNRGKTEKSSLKSISVSLMVILVMPLTFFASLDRSTAFILKNSGIPNPNIKIEGNWKENCQVLSPGSNINSKRCKYGNFNSGKSILLIGDSHAEALSKAIVSLGNSNEMDTLVFTFPGCAFVLSNKDFNPAYSYPYLNPDCLEHNQFILRYIRNSKPTVVIYVARSSSIMVTPNNSTSRTQYKKMIRNNLEVLMKERIEIIHIGSTPELSPYLTIIQGGLNINNGFSKIPFEDNGFWESHQVTDYYLDTLNIFCPGRVCRNNSPEGWLFRDGNHLSEIGADRVIPALASLVSEILNNKPE
jgi:peptidoglycan/LPS O-acetylase OafA/YrhL